MCIQTLAIYLYEDLSCNRDALSYEARGDLEETGFFHKSETGSYTTIDGSEF